MRPELSAGGERSLRNFLGELVWRHFFEDVRLEEPRVTTYVASLLADFARTENLYRIRDAQGKRLEEVGEMLVESNPLLEAASFDRERELRKHVGDYTLFMTGLFPESVAKARRTRHPCRDAFIDFVQAGKESYAIVSSFNQFEYKAEAPLFRRLSENFELCVVGLNLVKQDLEEFQRESYQRLKRAVDDLPG
ncbi:MAG: hypothetical protein DMG41_24325 [Acidobacteria bacterium]|nr:MAG: hypothetical protein AUH13_25835 [Acidobacteria bacterium 13_2_20CM_58_27]PYT66393.1 MAG: hypothetical protein DMG42_29450 [Acidobacteriota bacterium]PYT85315.1 MAG: hypothetical protein DMG41_24325 [Acidobacteriota bacterium]